MTVEIWIDLVDFVVTKTWPELKEPATSPNNATKNSTSKELSRTTKAQTCCFWTVGKGIGRISHRKNLALITTWWNPLGFAPDLLMRVGDNSIWGGSTLCCPTTTPQGLRWQQLHHLQFVLFLLCQEQPWTCKQIEEQVRTSGQANSTQTLPKG
jgi:hypothetical protein